ncbi:aspartate aminotransferase family protein [Brevibacillus marinus]|uniref:aminotransferase family protein n=1 Tax=Brevibacillus marinus TaxID=2496837 RepID=UPI000F825BD1|nr:aspartate aminotransferase family protein [Brevibacillus marinus]
MAQGKDYVFHRDLTKTYPIITRAEGVYLYEESGKRYLDASSGAIAVNLGHGVDEIVYAMAKQAKDAAFVHTLRFETHVLHELSREIAELAPGSLNRVFYTTGGSEANESAMKLARQYHRDRGNAEKWIVIGRWQAYHGNTIGSLSAGGDIKRRKPFTPMLLPYEHVPSPHCSRCPYGKTLQQCQATSMACVDALERLILEIGPEFVSAFICEPIVGSQQGAVVPPEGYLRQVRELCNRYDIILIIDEVMCGFGRTGKHFAVEHFAIEPDILTFGKGVSSGYAPLGGMIVSDRIVQSLIENSGGKFTHGYTYSGHPVSVAAGLAAVRYYKEKDVLANCQQQSAYLFEQLELLRAKHRIVGEIRGKGLLIGFELVMDRERGTPFPPKAGIADRLNQIAMEQGAVFYPGSGGIDGEQGEHLLIGPPLTINQGEIKELVAILDHSLTLLETELFSVYPIN